MCAATSRSSTVEAAVVDAEEHSRDGASSARYFSGAAPWPSPLLLTNRGNATCPSLRPVSCGVRYFLPEPWLLPFEELHGGRARLHLPVALQLST